VSVKLEFQFFVPQFVIEFKFFVPVQLFELQLNIFERVIEQLVFELPVLEFQLQVQFQQFIELEILEFEQQLIQSIEFVEFVELTGSYIREV